MNKYSLTFLGIIIGCGDADRIHPVIPTHSATDCSVGGRESSGVDGSVGDHSIVVDGGMKPALKWVYLGKREQWPTVVGSSCRLELAFPAVCEWSGQNILIAPQSAIEFPFESPVISGTSVVFTADQSAALVSGLGGCVETHWSAEDVELWECMR